MRFPFKRERPWLVIPVAAGLTLLAEQTEVINLGTSTFTMVGKVMEGEARPKNGCPDMELILTGSPKQHQKTLAASILPYADAAIAVSNCFDVEDGCQLTIKSKPPIVVQKSDRSSGMVVTRGSESMTAGALFNLPELASCRVSSPSYGASPLVLSSPQ